MSTTQSFIVIETNFAALERLGANEKQRKALQDLAFRYDDSVGITRVGVSTDFTLPDGYVFFTLFKNQGGGRPDKIILYGGISPEGEIST